MSKKIKVGVIGLGNMGRHHVRQLANIDSAELVAICDTHTDRVNEYASTYNCTGHTDIDAFLEESLDAVSVVVPTSKHFEVSKRLLEANCHLLIEKPITQTLDEAETLIQLANDKNLTLMVGHIEQFNPAFLKLLDVLKTDSIGTPQSLISRRVGPQPAQIKDAGVIIDLAVHDIGLQTQIMGHQPSDVASTKAAVQLKDREDRAEFFLNFGEASGYIQVNWLSPKPIRTLSVTGSKGIAEIDFGKKTLTIVPESGTEETFDLSSQDALNLELTAFIEAIQTNTAPKISGQDGLNTLKIALKGLS